tara:strand:+ start:931 stop:1431 length:501 start_codon:yes stop_codon:yes gene_type:complete
MKLLLFLIFIFLKSTTFVNATNVVYIDMNHIISNSIHGKLILGELEIKNKANIKVLENKEEILKNLEKSIASQKNILSKNELDKKINDLKSKILVFRNDKDKLSKEFNELKNKKISIFMKNIQPLISDYIEKNSINIVLNKKDVIIGIKDHDITFKILEIVNKNIK